MRSLYTFWMVIAITLTAGVHGLLADSTKPDVNDAKRIKCGDIPSPSPGNRCNVTPGATNRTALALRGVVLTIDTIFEGGEVLIDDSGIIRYVGCSSERPAALNSLASASTRVDCAEGVISPGLINLHDHLDFNHNGPAPASATRYNHRNDWRPTQTATSNPTQLRQTWNEMRHVMTGTTSMASSSGILGFARNLDLGSVFAFVDLLWNVGGFPIIGGIPTQPIETPTVILSDTFPLEENSDFTQNAGDCSLFPDYPSLAGLKGPSDVFLPHAAEGINAAALNELACLTSTANNGVDINDGDNGFIHGMAINAEIAKKLADQGSSLIWSPRSNASYYGNTAPVRMLKNQGVLIALGTDWNVSGSATMPRELTCAAEWNEKYLDHAFTDRELWLMATYNAALTLNDMDKSNAGEQVAARIGSLSPGLYGDISVFDGTGYENPYRAIIDANAERTLLVLRRISLPFSQFPLNILPYAGSIALYGDANILSGLPDTLHEVVAPGFGVNKNLLCETINVCGVQKKICPLRESWWFGVAGVGSPVTYQFHLAPANAGSYELFSCGTPTDEPVCTPSRPGEYAGTSVTTGPFKDSDGDGIFDPQDNCKKVFNPIRPMDGGVQADVDGDGKGDACDKCPLDFGTSCTAVDPYTGEIMNIDDAE